MLMWLNISTADTVGGASIMTVYDGADQSA